MWPARGLKAADGMIFAHNNELQNAFCGNISITESMCTPSQGKKERHPFFQHAQYGIEGRPASHHAQGEKGGNKYSELF